MSKNGSLVCIERVEDIRSYPQIKATLYTILAPFREGIRIPPGGRAMIKLNLCLLKGPETGSTVDPMVAKALVEWLLEHFDLRKIYLAEADATHLGAEMAFRALGWYDVFGGQEKVEFFNLSEDQRVPVASKFIPKLEMAKTMMEVEFLVSLAKLKTHTMQKITGIMKNQFGAIPYKYKIIHHRILGGATYDATAARPPDLCVIDGLIAMEGNGPTNGIPRRTKLLLASNDAVSMDHFCARLIGFRPGSIPPLRIAANNGLGSTVYEVRGNPPDPLNLKFRFLPTWKQFFKKGVGLLQRGAENEEE